MEDGCSGVTSVASILPTLTAAERPIQLSDGFYDLGCLARESLESIRIPHGIIRNTDPLGPSMLGVGTDQGQVGTKT